MQIAMGDTSSPAIFIILILSSSSSLPFPIHSPVYCLQVLCWGVRGMKRFQLLRVSSPMVELECGGKVVRCQHIEDATKHPNFPEPVVFMDLVMSIHISAYSAHIF